MKTSSTTRAFFAILFNSLLTPTLLNTILSIYKNFFVLQYKAAFFTKNVIPVTFVDHPLDAEIPFKPDYVLTYMDFSAFWVRSAYMILKSLGKKAIVDVRDFIVSIGKIYFFAAEVYSKNLSTTHRPHYLRRFNFLVIHLFDPHLMCIPSLHVMVVVKVWTTMRSISKKYPSCADFAEYAEFSRRHALLITESILYVKQHSINCIAAAMYAMTCFDSDNFSMDDAHAFASDIVLCNGVPPETRTKIVAHIISLYNDFHSQYYNNYSPHPDWTMPLINFLHNYLPTTSI
jgi:hypothetical protein